MARNHQLSKEMEQLAAVLCTALGSESVRISAPLGPLTTYRVGGRADILVIANSIGDLELLRDNLPADVPMLVIGRGSNMLVAESGFCGVALQMGRPFEEIIIEGTDVRAGAAVALPILARRTVSSGLAGMEWAVGVPGSVGGGVRMNAGGHGASIADSLRQATLFSFGEGRSGVVPADSFQYGYRHSNIAADEIVLDATFGLRVGDRERGTQRIEEIVTWRREHQPGGQNAGSFFRNPPEHAAGFYIDEAGLKGFRIGSAYVHPKHANFIQVDEGGSADDVFAVMRSVREQVHTAFDIELEPEVRLIGFEEHS